MAVSVGEPSPPVRRVLVYPDTERTSYPLRSWPEEPSRETELIWDQYPQQHQHQHQHQHQPQQGYQHQQQQPQQQSVSGPGSPPHTASPFAFAPPPLSNTSSSQQGPSRPLMPMHASDPLPLPQQGQQQGQQQQQQQQQSQYAPYYQKQAPPPPPQHHNSYPYGGSAPMAYRSYSGESPRQGHAPSPGMGRMSIGSNGMQANGNSNGVNGGGPGGPPGGPNGQPSPNQSSPYPYNRPPPPQAYGSQGQPLPPPVPQHQQSPQQRPLMYPTPYYPGPYGQPGAAEMPRSLSYPSTYTQQGYPGGYMPPMPSHMHSMPSHPSLARHNTTAIGEGMSSMDLGRAGPNLGYSFASRLPLVDRPFKCDECVQSFVS